MDDIKKFELTSLPKKSQFYSKLREEEITDTDYNKASNVWNHFNIKNMLEYHNLYLKTDVLLMADVFENFRNKGLEIYGLDLAHHYTAPAFSFDSMLK